MTKVENIAIRDYAAAEDVHVNCWAPMVEKKKNWSRDEKWTGRDWGGGFSLPQSPALPPHSPRLFRLFSSFPPSESVGQAILSRNSLYWHLSPEAVPASVVKCYRLMFSALSGATKKYTALEFQQI